MKEMISCVPAPVYHARTGEPRKTMINITKVPNFDRSVNANYFCSHGCSYCYARKFTKFCGDIKEDCEWEVPLLVPNALELVKAEIPKLKPGTRIHLSFMTDPFMYGYENICKTSFEIIKTLNEAGYMCSVLTKGILPIELASLSKGNWYGVTVVTLDEFWRMKHEPGAARIMDRVFALKRLSLMGCNTFISCEPFFPPWMYESFSLQSLTSVLTELRFVNHVIFGRPNHIPEVNANGDYRRFYYEAAEVVRCFCEAHGITYQIKPGTVV